MHVGANGERVGANDARVEDAGGRREKEEQGGVNYSISFFASSKVS